MKLPMPKFNVWHVVAIISTVIAAGTKFVGDLVSDQESDEDKEEE